MSVVSHEKQREYFIEAINDIQKDFQILIEYASETNDVKRKEHIELIKVKFNDYCR